MFGQFSHSNRLLQVFTSVDRVGQLKKWIDYVYQVLMRIMYCWLNKHAVLLLLNRKIMLKQSRKSVYNISFIKLMELGLNSSCCFRLEWIILERNLFLVVLLTYNFCQSSVFLQILFHSWVLKAVYIYKKLLSVETERQFIKL